MYLAYRRQFPAKGDDLGKLRKGEMALLKEFAKAPTEEKYHAKWDFQDARDEMRRQHESLRSIVVVEALVNW